MTGLESKIPKLSETTEINETRRSKSPDSQKPLLTGKEVDPQLLTEPMKRTRDAAIKATTWPASDSEQAGSDQDSETGEPSLKKQKQESFRITSEDLQATPQDLQRERVSLAEQLENFQRLQETQGGQ